jgi:hypothetical protein
MAALADLFAGAAIEGKFVSDGGWRGKAATVEASGWLGLVATCGYPYVARQGTRL